MWKLHLLPILSQECIVARSVLLSLRVPISLQAGLSCELAGPAVTEDRTDTSAVSTTQPLHFF